MKSVGVSIRYSLVCRETGRKLGIKPLVEKSTEIANYGDNVKIRTRPTLTISDYQADGPLTIQRPGSNIIEFPINKGKYFQTILDDVLRVQADMPLLDIWSEEASEQLKISIDTEVLAAVPAGIVAANKGTTAGRISVNVNLGVTGTPLVVVDRDAAAAEAEIMDLIIDLGLVLDEQNIPETNRWLILPAWACAMLKKSELRDASIMGDTTSVYRNGRLGMLDRFTVYSSNLLPKATEGAATAFWIFAGHMHGLTFASQLSEMETLRAESTFGTILRGLQVYGHKVIDGIAIAGAYVVKG